MSKKGPTGNFFFHFGNFVFPKMDNIFLPKKIKKDGKKKIAAARLPIITATRWTGNRLFVVDSLSIGRI